MGYYMRFFTTATDPVSVSTIETALKRIDARYAITDQISGRGEAGVLTFDGGAYAQIEINRRGDGLFEEEVEEFREAVEVATAEGRKTVLKALEGTNAIVAIQVLFQGRETEETLRRIDPLWPWLFESQGGLLQVDRGGWYDRSGRILTGE